MLSIFIMFLRFSEWILEPFRWCGILAFQLISTYIVHARMYMGHSMSENVSEMGKKQIKY
jgi:hypothetical protein